MDRNIGELDRVLRIVIGMAIITTGTYFESWMALVGFAPLITGVTGFCPIRELLGISPQQPEETEAK